MVSTDDKEIAKTSKDNGAKAPFMRSSKNSSDLSTTADVIKEVIDSYSKLDIRPQRVCCIYPTAPLLSYEILGKAYELITKTNSKSVIPETKFTYPIQRSFNIENNRIKMKWPKNINARSQDLSDYYHDVGQFYFLDVKSFIDNPVIFSDFTSPIEIPKFLPKILIMKKTGK